MVKKVLRSVLSLFLLLAIVQVASCWSHLSELKAKVSAQPTQVLIEDLEGQSDFSTDLDKLLMQATILRSKIRLKSDKAISLTLQGLSNCNKINKSIKLIEGTIADLRRATESDKVCPVLIPEELMLTLSKSPLLWSNPKVSLNFLSERLSAFRSAKKIFSTRNIMSPNVARDFHQACDNIPNTLVIIKSGQYIAGGFTAAEWKTPTQVQEHARSDSPSAFFIFSANRERVYDYVPGEIGITFRKYYGPVFGDDEIEVDNEYPSTFNSARMAGQSYSNQGVENINTEFFGQQFYSIDEYEVYALQYPASRD